MDTAVHEKMGRAELGIKAPQKEMVKSHSSLVCDMRDSHPNLYGGYFIRVPKSDGYPLLTRSWYVRILGMLQAYQSLKILPTFSTGRKIYGNVDIYTRRSSINLHSAYCPSFSHSTPRHLSRSNSARLGSDKAIGKVGIRSVAIEERTSCTSEGLEAALGTACVRIPVHATLGLCFWCSDSSKSEPESW